MGLHVACPSSSGSMHPASTVVSGHSLESLGSSSPESLLWPVMARAPGQKGQLPPVPLWSLLLQWPGAQRQGSFHCLTRFFLSNQLMPNFSDASFRSSFWRGPCFHLFPNPELFSFQTADEMCCGSHSRGEFRLFLPHTLGKFDALSSVTVAHTAEIPCSGIYMISKV